MHPNSLKNLKPFTKGDPRINRNGRPKTFDAFRKLVQKLLHEEAKDKKGNIVVIDNKKVTNIEAIARSMMADKRQRPLLIEYAFGKVPNETILTGKDGGPIQVTKVEVVKDYGDSDSSTD